MEEGKDGKGIGDFVQWIVSRVISTLDLGSDSYFG